MSETLTIRDLTHCMMKETAHTRSRREDTFCHYGFPFVNSVNEFGDKKIDELTTEEIRKVLQDLDRRKAVLLFRSLDLVIRYGILQGHGTTNPCDALREELASIQDRPSKSSRTIRMNPVLQKAIEASSFVGVTQSGCYPCARHDVAVYLGHDLKTGAHRRKRAVVNGAYKDAYAQLQKMTKEQKLVELLQDALETIDDMLECTPHDLEEYGRAVALEERLRISGEMELHGYDGFFDRD